MRSQLFRHSKLFRKRYEKERLSMLKTFGAVETFEVMLPF